MEGDRYETMYADEFMMLGSVDYDVPQPSTSKKKLFFDTKGEYLKSSQYESETFNGIERINYLNNENFNASKRKNSDSDESDIFFKKQKQSFEGNILETVECNELFLNEKLNMENYTYSKAKVWNVSKILRRIPKGTYISVTCDTGNRYYIRMKERIDTVTAMKKYSKILDDPRDILQNTPREKCNRKPSRNSIISQDLWVDRYRPKNYMHLLSDESINRTLLQWLKLWDKLVFGKETKLHNSLASNDGKIKSYFSKDPAFQLISELDENKIPKQRIVLLTGNAGLGKTTLAHVVAKQAGYNVIEMNASDDRTPEIFHTNILTATEMKSVIGSLPKPNCLIIDEIDGAPGVTIDVLIKLIAGVKTHKKRKVKYLLRPIICICNDAYAPSLRILRQKALVLTFSPITPIRLAQRLHEIVSLEGFQANMSLLLYLAEKTGCDIRSCLSTLQFVSSQSDHLELSHLNKCSFGQKDMQQSLSSVLKDILHSPQDKNTSLKIRFEHILQISESFGELTKLNQALFDNYMQLKLKENSLHLICSTLNWFEFFDFLEERIKHYQTFFLSSYLPFSCVSFHLFLSDNSRIFPKFPSSYYEISAQLYNIKEKEELEKVVCLMSEFHLSYLQHRNTDGFYDYILEPRLEDIVLFPGCKSLKKLQYSVKQIIAKEIETFHIRQSQCLPSQREDVENATVETTGQSSKRRISEKSKKIRCFFQIERDSISKQKKIPDENKASALFDDVWFHFKEGVNNAVRRNIKIKNLI